MRPVPRARRDRLGILATIVLVLAACSPPDATTTTTAVEPEDASSTTTATTTRTITTDGGVLDEPPCSAGDQPFVQNGGAGLIERADSDADIIAGLAWTSFGNCDRLVIDFVAASGAPAVSPPGVGPLFIRSAGVLRLQLDAAVTGSAILDQVVDSNFVHRAFVVRRPTDELFVDLHLKNPAVVRVNVAAGPARILVDLLAGGDAYTSPAIVTEDLVVVDPVGGPLIYPFTVNGYLRTLVDTMTVALESGEVTTTHEGEVGPKGDTWGAFTVLISDGPDGSGTLIVGDRIPIAVELS
ncbi:MAG TPA: hypothetical protein VMS74_06110 [Acidimicrobiia bacterium]|nr:hypothetical protein [Acidimicrobiia bacterium]